VEYTSTPIVEDGALQGAVVVFRDVTARKDTEAQLQVALDDVQALTRRLEAGNECLQEKIRERHHFGDIIGRSPAIGQVQQVVETVAPTNASVLITGESGTGKELVARAVHRLSPRRDRPLITVNCASVPRDLFESEFFGHLKGAFAGVGRDRVDRAVLTARNGRLQFDVCRGVGPSIAETQTGGATQGIRTDAELQVAHDDNLRAALEQTGWKIYGPGGTADLLGRATHHVGGAHKEGRADKAGGVSSVSRTLSPRSP